jgi:hypothetical protein
LHSRVHVCDEIGDLLVALTKCLNAPILIVDEIHGAIHVLIHGVISVPEVVPAHLDPLQARADRPDLVRAAPLALEMMIVAAIHVVAIVIVHPVAIMGIDPVVIVIVHPVVILAIVPLVIVVRVVNSVIDLLVILVVATVIVPLVVMALMPVVILVIVLVVIVVLVVSTVTARPVIALLVGTSEIVPVLIVDLAGNMATDLLVIVHRAVILEIAPVVIVGRVRIVDPVVSTETDRFVAMTAAVILAAAIVPLVVILVIVPLVIGVPAENSVIVTALRAVTIQDLTHVAATEIVLLVAMAQALAAHRARVVMTAVMAAVAVDRVAKTSHLVDQRTKLSVVVKPCVHEAAAKSAKTASKHQCHAKPRPGLMKVESNMTFAMPPKVPCAVGSHRAALCRRDQKMKTS